MEHLQVFIDWAQRPTCQIKSAKQQKFFFAMLKKAMKQHTGEVVDCSHWEMTVVDFFFTGDKITSTDYMSVEIKKYTRNSVFGQMRVFFGQDARERFGIDWNGFKGAYAKTEMA